MNKRVDEALADWRAPFADKAHSWERIQMRIAAQDHPVVHTRSRRFRYAAVAIGLVLIASVLFLFQNGDSMYSTQMAEIQVLTLPDGSEVTLNAATELRFDEADFLEERTLELDGEAFFQVEKGSRFSVVTDQGTISVLGTSFNVCDRGDFLEVICSTGKVRVDDGRQSFVLTPGQSVDNLAGRLTQGTADTDAAPWIRGVFRFEDRPLGHVMEEMERQFGVTITTEDVGERFFTGEFESADLESALTVICRPLGLDYTISDNGQIRVTNR
ncbi:MAG: DUF4974 domain-containing protein [Flavobacteriales bacterium]|nr:DUF4974 domain-containing protein [Flavobacteriales bacterium]